MQKYDDEYESCEATYVSLCVYHEVLEPDAITSMLRLEPSVAFRKGHVSHLKTPAPRGGWFLSSKLAVESKDLRRHVDWVLDRLQGREQVIEKLHDDGYDLLVSCYWLSAKGHGGPTLSPRQMGRLADLGLDLWIDLY